jgi:hypothetical protein
MELFQRVNRVAQEIAGSQVKLAEALGIIPRTLNGYLNEARQKKLWPLLDKILAVYPQLSRAWLYNGEGEMLTSPGGWETVAKPMLTAQGRQTAEAVVQGVGGHGLETENMYLRQRILDLEARIASMQDALDSKDKMLEMYEALSAELVLKKDRVPRSTLEPMQHGGGHSDVFTSRTGNASTGTTAAPLQNGTER